MFRSCMYDTVYAVYTVAYVHFTLVLEGTILFMWVTSIVKI